VIELGRDTVFEGSQIIHSRRALQATCHMIFHYLQFSARQSPINIIGRLLKTQMRPSRRRLSHIAEHDGFQREESRIAAIRRFYDLSAAAFATIEVVEHRIQSRRREFTPDEIFNLVVRKMRGQVSYLPHSPESGRLTFI
jgi:hypothetical protein